ncbi:hypothetical protein jhhlp_001091 [Lomentospora prolificans]|uniref:Microbial-type PARG catalytic domain-containing protein n=1 Tax=Lomentospora prolificans TaxID=41688 RepID=A0A2N3NH93_9PEZI|nr:hypothetical protein jhhlp_001091 [Lomentospora prolificans]
MSGTGSASQVPPHRHSSGFRSRPIDPRRESLACTAAETRTVLPSILSQLPSIQASRSEHLHLDELAPLKAADCPKYNASTSYKTSIRIVDGDSWNVAIDLGKEYAGKPAGNGIAMADRVAVLNMASHKNPGGGWLRGAMAQEEALCYRSSLALSLHRRYYPFRQLTGLYSPDVVVIRGDYASGHQLYMADPNVKPEDLPVCSVLSVAAVCRPKVKMVFNTAANVRELVYADNATRTLMKGKMRMSLRMAAARGHSLLVLGALGCGAFKNPPREVAQCWLDVLQEAEFAGGWWREIVFAVLDTHKEGNFDVFTKMLGGTMV